jgi:hypothetical protein
MLVSSANAVVATYNDSLLGNGLFSWNSGGVNLSLAATAGGTLSSIGGSGGFAGVHLGTSVSSTGLYTFTLSQAVTSFEFEFDALSNTGGTPPEQITGFTTNIGPVNLAYLNQGGTTFAAGVITSTLDDGQGTVTLTSAVPFTSVTFLHTQNPNQNGFVIERVTIDTGAGAQGVPDHASTLGLMAGSLAVFASLRRRWYSSK